MQSVDSIERDFAAALIAILERYTPEELFRSRLGEWYAPPKEMRQLFTDLVQATHRALEVRDSLKPLTPKTVGEIDGRSLSLRRFKNIFKVDANFNTRTDLLHGVDLIASSELKTLEQYRYVVVEGYSPRPQEPGQAAPKVGVAEVEPKGNTVATPGPEALITKLRGEGVTDTKGLAAEVDKHFPGLSFAKLGELLPATPGATVGYEARKS